MKSPDALSRGLHRFAEPRLLFPLVGVLVVGIIWGTTLSFLRTRHVDVEQSARVSTQEILETYEAQVVRALGGIEQTMNLVTSWRDGMPSGHPLAQLRDRDLLPPTLLFAVSIADREGRITESTREEVGGTVATEDYFQAQRAGTDLYVTRRAATAALEPTLLFTRRLSGADGRSFDGVVIVAVDASYFVSGYDAAKLGQHGLLGLVGTNGDFHIRRTGDMTAFDGHIDYAALSAGDEGDKPQVYRAVNDWDRVERWTTARELFGFPLAIIVGLSVDEQFAAAQRVAHVYLLLAALGTVVALIVLGVLGRLSWRLAKGRQLEVQLRQEHAESVEYIAYHDGLTGLPNRSLFSKLLLEGIGVAQQARHRLAVGFIDLDRFKTINDTLGHDAGDQLLQQVATRLRDCVREGDTVARLGGDEFVVLAPRFHEDGEIAEIAMRILHAVARPFQLNAGEVRVTASIGIATCPDNGIDEQSLKKNADIAMYKAKSEGKNNYQFYNDNLNATSLERLSLEANLRHALERDEFRLLYQVKRDLKSGRITGVEALLRWEHPDLGTIAPLHFLPIAEETGIIIPMGYWVIGAACAQIVEWQRSGLPAVAVAVNLSVKQFYDDQLLPQLRSILAAAAVDPLLIELELPESTLTAQPERTRRILTELKAIGVRIAVGDFGLGYASLSLLHDFAFDTIKLDRSLARELTENQETSTLTDAVIAMARSLSMTVVAQGVETSEQAAFLREHACNELQGFYAGKPMPAAELARVLASQPLAKLSTSKEQELARTG